MCNMRNPKAMKPVTAEDNLPEEIFFEILSALSVRSLCQLRCVSKMFRALTFEPEFAKLQYDKASNDPLDIRHRKLLIASNNRFLILSSEKLARGESLNQEDFAPTDFDFQFNPEEEHYAFTSCRGLICLKLFESEPGISSIFLHDTFTKQVKRVPPYDLENVGYRLGFGFGYDNSTRDFKIVRPYLWYGFGGQHNVAIYSLRTNSWRTLTYPNLQFKDQYFLKSTRNDMGVFVDGKLYWLLRPTSGSSMLLCFNLETEQIDHQLVLPPHKTWNINMGVSEGCLSVWIVYDEMSIPEREHKRPETIGSTKSIEIWVMKKHDHENVSWSKVGLIRKNILPNAYLKLTPLMVSNSGQAFMLENMEYCTDLSVYDIVSGERKELYKFKGRNDPISSDTVGHVPMETLLSPYQF